MPIMIVNFTICCSSVRNNATFYNFCNFYCSLALNYAVSDNLIKPIGVTCSSSLAFWVEFGIEALLPIHFLKPFFGSDFSVLCLILSFFAKPSYLEKDAFSLLSIGFPFSFSCDYRCILLSSVPCWVLLLDPSCTGSGKREDRSQLFLL